MSCVCLCAKKHNRLKVQTPAATPGTRRCARLCAAAMWAFEVVKVAKCLISRAKLPRA